MGGAEQDQDDQESAPESDPRARLLGERVARSLRVEADLWARCAGSPETRPLLRAFLEGDSARRRRRRLLLVTRGATGHLGLAEQFPLAVAGGRAGKAVFLLRLAPGPLDPSPTPRHLLCGDLASATLEHLATLVEEVGLPEEPRQVVGQRL